MAYQQTTQKFKESGKAMVCCTQAHKGSLDPEKANSSTTSLLTNLDSKEASTHHTQPATKEE